MRAKHDPALIAKGRMLYAEGAAIAEIVRQTGLPPGTLYHHLRTPRAKAGITLPPIPLRRDESQNLRRKAVKTSRPALIARLWSTAERQVAEIETRLSEAGGNPADLERDAKTLAVLARTVRDLVALDESSKPKADGDAEQDTPRDIDAFRRDLAEKLAELGKLEGSV